MKWSNIVHQVCTVNGTNLNLCIVSLVLHAMRTTLSLSSSIYMLKSKRAWEIYVSDITHRQDLTSTFRVFKISIENCLLSEAAHNLKTAKEVLNPAYLWSVHALTWILWFYLPGPPTYQCSTLKSRSGLMGVMIPHIYFKVLTSCSVISSITEQHPGNYGVHWHHRAILSTDKYVFISHSYVDAKYNIATV